MNQRILLENDITEIKRLTRAISAFGRANRLSRQTLLDIRLIFEEIVTNIIKYGYDDTDIHVIEVKLAAGKDAMEFEIVDDARPFNPLEHPDAEPGAPLVEQKIGGAGLHLVKHLTEAATYENRDGKNRLRFEKTYAKGERWNLQLP